MTRHILFVTAVLATAILVAPAQTVTALQCEDHAVNCGARCTDVTGGAGEAKGHHNKCIESCARRASICLSNAFIRSNGDVRY